MIAQNIHVNPERVKVISFTGPAWWYGPVVLVQKGNPDGIKSYDDFKGQTVGAISGSAAENYLRRIGANTQPFKTEVEELQSLDQGRVKYVVEDDVIYTVFAKENPNANDRGALEHRDALRHHLRRRLRQRPLRHPQGGLPAAGRLHGRARRAARERLRELGPQEIRAQRPQPVLVQAQSLSARRPGAEPGPGARPGAPATWSCSIPRSPSRASARCSPAC